MLVRYPTVLGVSLLCSAFVSGCHQQSSERSSREAAQVATASESAPTSRAQQVPIAEVAPPRPSGSVRFTDVTQAAGIHFRHHSGAFGKKYLPETMGSGVCVIDYNDDGWQDILFVNSMDWPEQRTGQSTAALYRNNGDGTYTDVTREAGLGTEMYGLGCAVRGFRQRRL